MIDCDVRIANKADIEGILFLENQYGVDVYSKDSILSTFDYDYYHTYVAVIDNEIVGYVSATIIYDECNLIKIIVDKNHRECGIGKILLHKLIEKCKSSNVSKIYLEVRSGNDVAKSFYRNNGFEHSGLRKNYYPDGCDAEIFWYYMND